MAELPISVNAAINTTDVVKVFKVPANAAFASITINVSNPGGETAKVKVGKGLTEVPSAAADWFEPGANVPSGGLLRNSCIIFGPNEYVYLQSDKPIVASQVWGLIKINE